jgi:hypothetical protein
LIECAALSAFDPKRGHAKELVAEGEVRLVAQEIRVAKLEGKDREGCESRKLLRTMRDTQNFQVGHVRLLEWELGEDQAN